MKQTISLLLALLLLVMVFTGCGKAGTAAETTTAEESVKASPVEHFEYAENENGITITKYVGDEADVVIPDTIDSKPVTEIGAAAFLYSEMISVKIPDTVAILESGSFAECPNLVTVILPESVKSIKQMAFLGCYSLEVISFPSSLSELGEHAFLHCKSLQRVRIPKTLTTWGNGAFQFSGIETIELEEGLESIGYEAFKGTNVKEIVLPESIKEISANAFESCEDLTSVTLNAGLHEIGYNAFCGTNLTEITIPSSVKTITEDAFESCAALEAVKFEGDAPVSYMEDETNRPDNVGSYTVYYHEGAKGFTSPEWFGYSTQIW